MSRYNWNWGVLFTEPYIGWLLEGIVATFGLALSGAAIALTLGSLVGIARTLPIAPLRWMGTAYVEVFRNIPLLVQMFLWFFVLPELLPKAMGHWLKRGLPYPEFYSAMMCLGFYYAARVAEQVRSGIESVPRALSMAARATGLSLMQTYRHILLPLAYRIIVPTLTSELLSIFKGSSIALTIGVLEITAQSRQIESYTFQGYEAFTAATVLYLAIGTLLLILMHRLDTQARIPGWISRVGE